jgi:hypothetical protein
MESPREPQQRKKISIRPIPEARKRQVTFMKRKKGLLKKAKELSILCDCDMAVLIFDKHNQCFQFASGDIEKTLERFERSITEGSGVYRESKTNKDVRGASSTPYVCRVFTYPPFMSRIPNTRLARFCSCSIARSRN